jgi:5-carboxymethyl-2-hydroxymuconate isomerase
MPHFRIEYSANLDGQLDMQQFCASMEKSILDTGLFELGAVRVRAFRAEAYAIADQLPENAFIDMVFRVGQGRASDALKAAGDAMFQQARSQVGKLFETPHFALSLEIIEIDGGLSWKDNAMHPRLRNKT